MNMQRRSLAVGSASESVHRLIWWTSQFATETGLLSAVGCDEGVLRRILRHFRAPLGCPRVERRFFEPSMMKRSSSSRAPRGGGVAGSLTSK